MTFRNKAYVKGEAAQAVYGIETFSPSNDYTLPKSVLVPLTNGVRLFVTDCAQLHPIDWFDQNAPNKSANVQAHRIVPGSTNGSDCVYFSDPFWDEAAKYGGHLSAVPLGDENQVAIEKEYWQAYTKSNHEHLVQTAFESLLSLWGFPAGIIVWLFYRLIRFGVKG